MSVNHKDKLSLTSDRSPHFSSAERSVEEGGADQLEFDATRKRLGGSFKTVRTYASPSSWNHI